MTITHKGQVTFPKAILFSLGIAVGDKIAVTVKGKEAIIKPLGSGILDIAGTLPPFKIVKNKTIDDMIHEAHDHYVDQILR